MITEEIQINTQVYENDKPVGGQVFEMAIDSDVFLQHEEKGLAIIQELLNEKSTLTTKYRFLSYEIITKKAVRLDSKEFLRRLGNSVR